METIEEYSKSKIPIQEREDFLFHTIDELDQESMDLYYEIIQIRSKEEIDSCFKEIVRLQKKFAKVKEAFDYLHDVEKMTQNFIIQRIGLKGALDFIATTLSYSINPIFGIFSFVSLTQLAGRHYIAEREVNEKSLERFETNRQLNQIQYRLEKCCDNFNENDSLITVEKSYNGEAKREILAANNYILLSLVGLLTFEEIEHMPKHMKERITKTIKKEANPNSIGLINLYYDLEEEKEKVYVRR